MPGSSEVGVTVPRPADPLQLPSTKREFCCLIREVSEHLAMCDLLKLIPACVRT